MKLSHPPVLILLDVLFVYLFILILNSSKETIEIVIPKDRIFKNAILLTIENKSLYKYDFESKKLVSFNLPTRFNKFIECNKQKECTEAHGVFGGEREFFIMLPSYLFEELSKVGMIALNKQACKDIKFNITHEGFIDKKELFKNNKCLEKVIGFKENF